MSFHVDLVAQENDLEEFTLVGIVTLAHEFADALEIFADFHETGLARDAVHEYEHVRPFKILLQVPSILFCFFV